MNMHIILASLFTLTLKSNAPSKYFALKWSKKEGQKEKGRSVRSESRGEKNNGFKS